MNTRFQYETSIRGLSMRHQYEVSSNEYSIALECKVLIENLAIPSLARSSLMRGRSNSTEVADLLNNL